MKNKLGNPKTVKALILNWDDLPKNIKSVVTEHFDWRFHNDIMIPYCSADLCPNDDEKWKDVLTKEKFDDWFNSNVTDGSFKGSFDEWIKFHGLEIDWWLYENRDKLDLNVDKIIFNICW
jgi:hypothetical protein